MLKPSELFTKPSARYEGFFSIQPIDNIPSIMQRGILSNEQAKCIQHTSIAMQDVQTKRDKIHIPNGMMLHQYANLYFDPKNPMLYLRKEQNEEICILGIEKSVLDIQGVIISDRNAASEYAIYYSPDTGLRKINYNLIYAQYWVDKDDDYRTAFFRKSVKCAEVLIPYSVPYEKVKFAIVINEAAENKLRFVGFDKNVVVRPGMFF